MSGMPLNGSSSSSCSSFGSASGGGGWDAGLGMEDDGAIATCDIIGRVVG